MYFELCVLFCFFYFKQKTAYEMRISDWSSDVCSSDLEGKGGKRDKKQRKPSGRIRVDNVHGFEKPVAPIVREVEVPEAITVGELANRMAVKAVELIKESGRAACRERVCK